MPAACRPNTPGRMRVTRKGFFCAERGEKCLVSPSNADCGIGNHNFSTWISRTWQEGERRPCAPAVHGPSRVPRDQPQQAAEMRISHQLPPPSAHIAGRPSSSHSRFYERLVQREPGVSSERRPRPAPPPRSLFCASLQRNRVDRSAAARLPPLCSRRPQTLRPTSASATPEAH